MCTAPSMPLRRLWPASESLKRLLERAHVVGGHQQAARPGDAGQTARQVDGAAVEVAAAGDRRPPAHPGPDAREVLLLVDEIEQLEQGVGQRGRIGAGEHRRVADHLDEPHGAARDVDGEAGEAQGELAELLGRQLLPEPGEPDEVGEGDGDLLDAGRPALAARGHVDHGVPQLLAELELVEVLERRADSGTRASAIEVKRSAASISALRSLSPPSSPSSPSRLPPAVAAEDEVGDHLAVRRRDLGEGHRHHPRGLLQRLGRDARLEQLPHALGGLEIGLATRSARPGRRAPGRAPATAARAPRAARRRARRSRSRRIARRRPAPARPRQRQAAALDGLAELARFGAGVAEPAQDRGQPVAVVGREASRQLVDHRFGIARHRRHCARIRCVGTAGCPGMARGGPYSQTAGGISLRRRFPSSSCRSSCFRPSGSRSTSSRIATGG